KLHLVSAPVDPAPLLSVMDVLLLTSRHEGLPNVLLEAQFLGVGVVTTDVGGASEAVLEGTSGWTVRSDRADALAGRVSWLLEDPQRRARAAGEGPLVVRRHFRLERLTARP